MDEKWEPWKEVRKLVGCSPQKARAIVGAARKALPYPRTASTDYINEAYGADRALIAGLKAMLK